MPVFKDRAGFDVAFEADAGATQVYASTIGVDALFGAGVTGHASQVSSLEADVPLEGDSAGWPGYPVAFDDVFIIEMDFGLDLTENGSAVLPFEFDRGIDNTTAFIDALRESGFEGGGTDLADSFELILSDGDEDISGGAVDLTNLSTGMSIVEINKLVADLRAIQNLLTPPAPPLFPSNVLTISNIAGNSPLLALGYVDNSGTALAAGNAVSRITASGVTSPTFDNVGPGNDGTLNAYMNGAIVATHTLTGTGDNGNYSGLVIADQDWYPLDKPGFWKSIDVSLNLLAAPIGLNRVKVEHTEADTTNEPLFVRDSLTATPVVTAGSVTQNAAGTLAYSSSVPHYNVGAVLNIGASISNLAGETYYGGNDPFTVTGTNSIFTTKTYTYSSLGITTPIPRNTTTAQAITTQTAAIDGTNIHNVGVVQGAAKNVNGAGGSAILSTTNILVKRGTAGGRFDENAVTVTGLGTTPNGNAAVRVSLGAGDTPSGAAGAWDSAAALPTYEAAVVAGVAGHNVINYATGYLPPGGPNFSTGRTGAQYLTLAFNRSARSTFKIVVNGTYAGCWVKLPGVSDTTPNAPNGWWNGFQPYDGAGVPGEAGDPNAGVALGSVMNGASGTFTITFGTQSSTNATANQILVRFKFNAGQQITALSFTN